MHVFSLNFVGLKGYNEATKNRILTNEVLFHLISQEIHNLETILKFTWY